MAARRRRAGTGPAERIKAWSYSRYSTYDTCPRKLKHGVIDRLPDPPGPAMARGSRIHEAAERYVGGLTKKLEAPELRVFADELRDLRAHAHVDVEALWAFTSDWSPCGWKDWDRAWCRVKTDAAALTTGAKLAKISETVFRAREAVARVVDYKTGREYPGHADQMELYGLAGLIMFPEVAGVRAELWYTDLEEEGQKGVIVDREFVRDELDALKRKWNGRAKRMLSDTTFDPTPGHHCRWCAFNVTKGGPCEAGA